MPSLLTAPLIRLRRTDGHVAVHSLPETLVALMRDEVAAFPALRPHQRHAWHSFLAQLAALALLRAGLDEPPEDSEAWCRLLRGLTPGFPDDEPWCLAVEDLTKPAFLQPPVWGGDLEAYRNRVETPDALDILVTAKNFDVKQAVARAAQPEDWLFALLDLQTMEGFMGAGNYGIARMNGGFSARPFLGLAPADGGPGAQLRRDIRGLLSWRAEVLEEDFGYRAHDGQALLWLLPWDGTESLPLDRLDPLFIEVCRRVRLVSEEGRLQARAAGSKAPRIAAKHLNGNTGDFWTPVNTGEGKAFSLAGNGFDARTLSRLLFSDTFRQAPAAVLSRREQNEDRDWTLVARGVARGQGKTEGWHERLVPFGRRIARRLGSPASRKQLEEISGLQIQEVAQIAKALRIGIATAASGGAEEPRKEYYDRAAPFTARLQAEADAVFFQALQERFLAGDDDDARLGAKRAFVMPLKDRAETLLSEAASSVPCPGIHRPRARARALRRFRAVLRSTKNNPLRVAADVFDKEAADG